MTNVSMYLFNSIVVIAKVSIRKKYLHCRGIGVSLYPGGGGAEVLKTQHFQPNSGEGLLKYTTFFTKVVVSPTPCSYVLVL